MPQSGHELPALVGPAAGWQLGGGLVRGQLHHRACHRRVLQHGAECGSGDGSRARGRGLSPSAAAPGAWTWVCVCLWGIFAPGPESTHAPSPALLPVLHLSSSPVPIADIWAHPPLSHFFLMALLSCLVLTCPGASAPCQPILPVWVIGGGEPARTTPFVP